MNGPLLLDLSHTSHTRARTGIQRVVRALHATLGSDAVAVCHDPFADTWRELELWEQENLTATEGAAGKRGAQWPVGVKLRGRLRRWSTQLTAGKPTTGPATRLSPSLPRHARALLVPEIFSPGVAHALPALFSTVTGPRVAIFHDAIALKFPELSPAKTVTRFPAYLQELLRFDGIAAISEDSRQSLLDYWDWLGVKSAPPVETIPLGLETSHLRPAGNDLAASDTPVVLSVGSIEGRKNHVALLEASERLWASGVTFELRLIGLAHPQTGRAALDRIAALQTAGRPLRYDGPVDDRVLEEAYAGCAFTVYPSLVEGFGLPVLESLARGRPCICSSRGALGESARGGGCVALDSVDVGSLSSAISSLLASPAARKTLADTARARRFKSWTTYASELTAWIATLREVSHSASQVPPVVP